MLDSIRNLLRITVNKAINLNLFKKRHEFKVGDIAAYKNYEFDIRPRTKREYPSDRLVTILEIVKIVKIDFREEFKLSGIFYEVYEHNRDKICIISETEIIRPA